jgi:phenylalanyl-tRNA synthetase alpha chain
MNNIPPFIENKIGRSLHNKQNNPIQTIKKLIQDHLGDSYTIFDNINPKVSVENNFDKLLIPKKHVSREPSDTYYIDKETVLRTHTSAHQNDLLTEGYKRFLVSGDVYRKDSIDRSHYPVFHQMEGVKICEEGVDVERDLKQTIEDIIRLLFPQSKYIMRKHSFPFTEPSWEVDVFYNNQWLEVLGCGVIHKTIINNCGLEGSKGWAFGLGLERLAMILFNIPDIRYFWTDDKRFHNQFNGEIVEFKEYSKYPICFKDISFWTSNLFSENNFCEIIRSIGKDLIEDVSLLDDFTHPTTKQKSLCYRITYRSNDRTLTNEEINTIQEEVIKKVKDQLKVDIRQN